MRLPARAGMAPSIVNLLLKYLATGGLLVAASSFSAQTQSLNVFDDWVLGCDNLRQCVAIGMEPEGNANGVYLCVLRSGK